MLRVLQRRLKWYWPWRMELKRHGFLLLNLPRVLVFHIPLKGVSVLETLVYHPENPRVSSILTVKKHMFFCI
ncbi:hypothetical protein OLMES_4401 [Oleiphilus messinensis]|uniref:Uncharacterized protein n=1 Tax=Oleiphilus messinensis TaxID=141451 RepID=A0A1Y0ICZ9_9GAMM|nr:hypothetical protein OLMES_4401 [Oleiphilus messinensis]